MLWNAQPVEQETRRIGAVLFDQSFHMTDHHIERPGVKRLVGDVAVNSTANSRTDIANHVVFCNQEGRYVADAIMFILDNYRLKIVDKPAVECHIQSEIGCTVEPCPVSATALESNRN